MEGGIKKTIILTVNGDLYSELKIIANSEEKTVEEMLQEWIRNLVKTRGSTQVISTDELERAKREIIEAKENQRSETNLGNFGIGTGVGLGGGPSTPSEVRSQTRFIRNSNEAVSVGGGDVPQDTVVFFCRYCFQKCRIPRQYIGQKVDCPRCRNSLVVPERSTSTS